MRMRVAVKSSITMKRLKDRGQRAYLPGARPGPAGRVGAVGVIRAALRRGCTSPSPRAGKPAVAIGVMPAARP